jgi:hypothetical protein
VDTLEIAPRAVTAVLISLLSVVGLFAQIPTGIMHREGPNEGSGEAPAETQPKDTNPFTPEYINEWYTNHKKLMAAQATQQQPAEPVAQANPSQTFETPDESKRKNGKPTDTEEDGCPVEITTINNSVKAALAAALIGVGNSNSWVMLTYRSNSAKIITAARFGIGYINPLGEFSIIDSIDTPRMKLKPGKRSSVVMGFSGTGNTHLVGWVEKVAFSDGTYWADSTGKCHWKP